MQVHARTQDHVAAIFLGLVAHGLAHLAYQLCVPCGCQTRANGETCGIKRMSGAPTGGVDAHAGRTVGQYGGRNAQTGDGSRGACSTSHEVGLATYGSLVAKEVVGTANQELGLLLKGHGLHHLVDVRRCQFGLCLGGCRHHAYCGHAGRKDHFSHRFYFFSLCEMMGFLPYFACKVTMKCVKNQIVRNHFHYF